MAYWRWHLLPHASLSWRRSALSGAGRRRRSHERQERSSEIIFLFSSLSLLSIGGGNTVLPEMHYQDRRRPPLAQRQPVRGRLRNLAGGAGAEHSDRYA